MLVKLPELSADGGEAGVAGRGGRTGGGAAAGAAGAREGAWAGGPMRGAAHRAR